MDNLCAAPEKARLPGVIALVLLALGLLVPTSAWAMDKAAYEGSFMVEKDLTAFSVASDNKYGEKAPSAFAAHGGEHSGVVTWTTPDDSIAIALSDYRYAFPTAEAASQFIADASSDLADGLSPVDGADSFGEQSRTFEGMKTQGRTQAQHVAVVFRVGNLVGKVLLIRQVDATHSHTMLSIFSNKAQARMVGATGVQQPRPMPVPAPTAPASQSTLKLPVSGLTVTLDGSWEVDRIDDDDGSAADRITRSAPGRSIGAIVKLRDKRLNCARIIEVLSQNENSEKFQLGMSGYYGEGVEVEGGKASFQCADIGRGSLTVFTMPPPREVSDQRQTLAIILDAAQPRSSVTPPVNPSPSPNYIATGDDDDDDDDGDFEFGFPHFVGVRAQVDGAYIIPDDAREKSFGIAAGLDIGFVTGRTIGFATDLGLALGYDFDGNVPFDTHVGIGFNVGFGPLSLVPLIGIGVDTRGAGDELTTHQMDAAFYWYPGGRLRLRFGPVALEGYAAATFRGSIEADQATDIGQLARVVARACYIDDDESEYYLGFRYTKYIGATDDNDVLLYPGAEQMGFVLGIGFSMAEALDD